LARKPPNRISAVAKISTLERCFIMLPYYDLLKKFSEISASENSSNRGSIAMKLCFQYLLDFQLSVYL
jgi:hypothetical protein